MLDQPANFFQSNYICERMHQTVGNILRTELYSNPPQNTTQLRDLIDLSLAPAMNATRDTIATNLGISPGDIAFTRYMFLKTPLISDWQSIQKHREHYVNENLCPDNLKQSQYDYSQDQWVMKKLHNPTKLGVRTNGPHNIELVHVNGTITIEIRPGITQLVNIRQVIPFCWIFSTYLSEDKSHI